MNILKTKSPRELLIFLEDKIYHYLPSELWDENLFFYNRLLKLMSLSVDDEAFNKTLMYKIISNGDICSIALLEVETETLYFIGDEIVCLNNLISFINNNKLKINFININNDNLASLLINTPNFHLNYCDKKLYKNEKSDLILNNQNWYIKEITHQNAQKYWDWITGALDEGYQYFAVIENKLIKCRAGLVRLSKNRSEIIAVNTISETDRNKGYASFLCNNLVNEALIRTKIVTWTCKHNNIASFRTTEKIGMKHYLSLYNFKFNK